MKRIFYYLGIFLIVFIVSRILLWLILDIPIGVKSNIYQISLVFFLFYRNRITYYFAILFLLIPIIYFFTHLQYSELSFFDFTKSLYTYYNSNGKNASSIFEIIPISFYIITLILFFTRAFRNEYKFSNKVII
jgi:hypothetical protein